MTPFKVICKNESNNWRCNAGLKVVVISRFFGLIKTTNVEPDVRKLSGPGKDEICIVIDIDPDGWYGLCGYPNKHYDPKYFIRLDEFEEGCKEIAEKSQPVLN